MKILMYGLACDKKQFDKYIAENSSPFVVAHYIFEKALIENMSKYKDVKIEHNYILQHVNKVRCNKYVHKQTKEICNGVDTTYVNYINMPVLKFLTLFIFSFFRSTKWCWRYRKHKTSCYIVSTINYFPVALANLIVSKLFRIKNIIILTDCSNGYAYMNNEKSPRIKAIKFKIKQLYKKSIHYLEKNYDGYIFFSEGMNEYINKYNRPWIVMEGMFNEEGINVENVDIEEKKRKKAIVYAGTLQPHLGINMFIEAFKKLEDKDIELWIFGDGDFRTYVEAQTKIDKRIHYYGFLSRDEVFKYEKKAKILINTRNPNDPYTWMSFPSKTFEYMVSGTPFLTTKLKSIPKEYHEFLYLTDYDINKISDKMKEILYKDEKEINDFGEKAKQFILNNKNPEVQSMKVYKFLIELAGGNK